MSLNRLKGFKARPARMAIALAAAFGSFLAMANPTLPTVVQGQASFMQQGKQLNISNLPGTVINWQSFSIAGDETTRFLQQNAASAVLNRVVGAESSQILGRLISNGQVYLVNPNGIFFGAGAQVDVAGLVVSSLQLDDRDFLAGKLRFAGTSTAGIVRNEGALRTPGGGRIALIAPQVENAGLIQAPGGEVFLAAGQRVSLVDTANPDVQVVVSAGAGKAVNLGQILAGSGRVGIYGALVQQAGRISADAAVAGEDGKIFLKASERVTLAADSRTLAQGGTITVDSLGSTQLAGELSVANAAGKGGEIKLLGNAVDVAGSARIDASGRDGGGSILVGGDQLGANPLVRNAATTQVAPGASLLADAGQLGDGGRIVVWADQAADVAGSLSARGGVQGGNGGFVETSGKSLTLGALSVDTRAVRGRTGNWLLDPVNVLISDVAAARAPSAALTTTANATTTSLCVGGGASCGEGLIDWLAMTNVNIQAAGDVALSAPLAWTSGNYLVLKANPGDVILSSSINSSAVGAAFTAIAKGAGRVRLLPGSSINVGGALTLEGNSGVVVRGPLATSNTADIILHAANGDIRIDSPVNAAGNLSLMAASGNLVSTTGSLSLEAQAGALSLSAPASLSGKVRLAAPSIIVQQPLVAAGIELQTDNLFIEPLQASLYASGTGAGEGFTLKTRSPGMPIKFYDVSGAGAITISSTPLYLSPYNLIGGGTPSAGQISASRYAFSANQAPIWIYTPISLGSSVSLSLQGSEILQGASVNAGDVSYLAEAGPINLSAPLYSSGKVILDARSGAVTGSTGLISQTSGGKIVASQLALKAAGDISLSMGINRVSYLAATAGGNVAFRNGIDLTTTSVSSSRSGGGQIVIDTTSANLNANAPGIDACANQSTGCTGSISLSGGNLAVAQLRAASVNLVAAGDISDLDGRYANNIVDPAGGQASLTYSAGGYVDLDAWGALISGTPAIPSDKVAIRIKVPEKPPTLDQCIADPNLSGCAKVLPTLAICIATPSMTGCSVVLPKLDQCLADPTLVGCSVVLPSLTQCTLTPTATGCQLVLPSLDRCLQAPATAGCAVVLPNLASCIATPSQAGCALVLPSISLCSSAPNTAGCSAVLPTFDACLATPTAAGCSAVLPSLNQCLANATLAGCSVVLPSLDRCQQNPTAAGCSVVLPPTDPCRVNPSAPGCSTAPPVQEITQAPEVAPQVNEVINSCNVVVTTTDSGGGSSTGGSGTRPTERRNTTSSGSSTSNNNSGGSANAPQSLCN